MKCPTCGDIEKQERLSLPGDGPAGYRCASCGRLYVSPASDLARLIDRVAELKASADWLANQHAQFSERIAELEAQIRAARGE